MPKEQKKPNHEIQKMSWTEVGKFQTYEQAAKIKEGYKLMDNSPPTKIRQRRNGFSVLTGKPVKTSNQEK